MAQSLEAGSYTDFSGLARLRAEARRDAGATLDQVARQFESVFMQMMMKSMRDAGFGDPLLGSKTVEFYQGMLDDQLSVNLSRSGSLGIAEMLEQQLRPLVEARGGRDTAGGDGALRLPGRSGMSWTGVQPVAAPEPSGTITDRQDFIDQIEPAARQAARRLGVPAELLLAQAALETGWGRAVPRQADGTSSHNLFGIKADGRWDGPRVTLPTVEFRDGVARREQAAFRAYPSFAASFHDYVDFLQSGSRYAPALAQAHDPEAFMRALHEAGYATDPRYADKVLSLWRDEVAGMSAGGSQDG